MFKESLEIIKLESIQYGIGKRVLLLPLTFRKACVDSYQEKLSVR